MLRAGSMAFSRAKGVSPHPQWPGTCFLCILHGGIRVGPGRDVVASSRPLGNERLPFIVPRGQRSGGTACFVRGKIYAHSSDGGDGKVCGAGTT